MVVVSRDSPPAPSLVGAATAVVGVEVPRVVACLAVAGLAEAVAADLAVVEDLGDLQFR